MQWVPSSLWGYVRDETHSAGQVMEVFVRRSTNSCSVFIYSLCSISTVCLACWTGCMLGLV